MSNVACELDRLRSAWARARGRDLVRRAHLALLVLAVLLAAGHRVLGPWPGLERLQGRLLLALAVTAGLLLLGWLGRHLLAPWLRPGRRVLARRLDDRLGWHDLADTALALEGRAHGAALGAFTVAQAAGRLREVAGERLWPARHDGVWAGRLLALLFLLLLVLPGVDGLLGERGAGRGADAGLGARGEGAGDLDAWLGEHARLRLAPDEAAGRPLVLEAHLETDAPLPEVWPGRLHLALDDVEVVIEDLDLPAGAVVDRRVSIDMPARPVLAARLEPGTHEARARVSPRAGPWRRDVVSNTLRIEIEEDGGGGGEDGDEGDEAPEEAPEEGPGAPEPPPPSEPEAPPPPPPSPPPPTPDGPGEGEHPPPPEAARPEVVDPFVRPDGERVHKEEALVAVPDDEAGLEPPPAVPLADAMRDLDRVLERAMGRERLRPADRAFLRRYFEALRARAGGGDR